MTSNNPNNDLKAALTVAQRQVERLIRDHPDQFPTYTEGGRWHFTDDPWAPGWSSGFLTGMIWIIALHTQDPWWREQAEHYCHLLEPRAADEETHDIGFLFTPSWGRWHEVDPGPRTKEILVRAGRTMAKRFNQNGKYLRSFVDPGSTFVDIMMNVDIIFQAAELSGDAALAAVARQHALTSRRFLVRGDGSTIHEGWFNPDSGEFLRAATHQGLQISISTTLATAISLPMTGTILRLSCPTRPQQPLLLLQACFNWQIFWEQTVKVTTATAAILSRV